MTAIVLPDVDRSTIEELRKRIPDLSEIELPSFEKLGKSADITVDRLRGRSRTPSWTWIAAGLGLVAMVGAIAALMSWRSRSSWSSSTSDPWTQDALSSMDRASDSSLGYGTTTVTEVTGTTTDLSATDLGTTDMTGGTSGSGLGLSAAEASLMSNDPSEERGL